MREIKFRAWCTELKDFQTDSDGDSGGITLEEMVEMHIVTQAPLPKTAILMQYTGLKDKNGKEIYEGDIVNAWYEEDGGYNSKDKGEVVYRWQDSMFALKPAFPLSQYHKFEIIGNIYENKELLK